MPNFLFFGLFKPKNNGVYKIERKIKSGKIWELQKNRNFDFKKNDRQKYISIL